MTGAIGALPPGLATAVRHWIAADPDPDTRAELTGVLAAAAGGDAAATSELTDRFAGRLEFGTAGLRAAVGAGPNRMNRVVVLQTAAGLASYLREQGHDSVVIGYDARHKSDVFARDTARVMVAAGIRTLVLPRPLPTPVTAYAIRALGVAAAVMVTASHNPPADNGYKVYVGPSQIAPPVDAAIAAKIDAVGPVGAIPTVDEGWETLDDGIVDAYVERAVGVLDPGSARGLRIAYTALHGVGAAVAVAALTHAGFDDVHVVAGQAEPDPDFPTVAFPNPEEPGAMDAVYATAAEVGADLVVANDPDADRCALAVPTPEGGWQMLRGDEVGVLLGSHLLQRDPSRAGTFATTIVSSSLLARIAAANSMHSVETLTGFKWLSRVPGLRYAYEEALGYCVDPDAVQDKDGISALLLAAELAAAAKADGASLLDRLDDLASQYGLHVTDQVSIRVDDLALIDAVMARVRADAPAMLGGQPVRAYDDLRTGSPDLPPTDGVRFRLESGGRVVIRPSGTEPKLKCYLEVVVPVLARDVDAARELAAREMDALRRDVQDLIGA